MEFSMENMCRTCMNEEGAMFSVFTVENRGISKLCYADMLMACATLHVAREDELPQQICQQCLKHLSIAYSFKQQCERSEATLREITKNPDIEFIKEEVIDDPLIKPENITPETNPDPLIPKEMELSENEGDNEEYKLTEEFLEDDFNDDGEEDLVQKHFLNLDPVQQFLRLKNPESPVEPEKVEELETEFLEDEYILGIEVDTPNTITLDGLKVKKSILSPKPKPGRIKERKCRLCQQIFRTPQAFRKHQKQHTKNLKCELCLKEFRSTHGLRYHMKIHNGIKNFACTFGNCTKKFRLKQALDKHLSIHNNEKNHLCALCGKTYSTYDALHYHLKAHRGERPYLCIHCGKTFKQHCHMKSHMWVHSGIKPHVCARCGKCYTSGHQLKKHINKHCSPQLQTIPQ